VPESWNDEELLEALRQAVGARESVPAEFVTAGKNAFAWHNIDAELAQLTYDSTVGTEHAPVRSEAAWIRALTFTSTRLTIELEVTEDSVLGQIVPAQSASIEVQTGAGTVDTISTDDIGCFSIRPIPPGQFRLRCRNASGSEVRTGWVTL
jgi:hypothetical protein